MPIDLATIFVTKAIEFGIGKVFEAIWTCGCEQRTEDRIGNVQYNILECPNCHKIHNQFTNACERTIGVDGRVAQIGVQFGSFTHYRDRGYLAGEILGWKCINIEAPVSYVCEGLRGESLIEVNDVYDLKTGAHICNDMTTFTPRSNRSIETRYARLQRADISENLFMSLFDRSALLAFDVRVENRYRDILMQDRSLHQL